MISCCNRLFKGGCCRVLSNRDDFYRRIEFGICPNCGVYRFIDFRIVDGKSYQKVLSGKAAESAYEKLIKNSGEIKQGSKSNQNFYYGDFKVSKKKDSYGNPVYLQLRKNFNDEYEILGEVKTKILSIG